MLCGLLCVCSANDLTVAACCAAGSLLGRDVISIGKPKFSQILCPGAVVLGRHAHLRRVLSTNNLANAAFCAPGGVRGGAARLCRAAGGAAGQCQGCWRAGAGRTLRVPAAALRVLPHQRRAGALRMSVALLLFSECEMHRFKWHALQCYQTVLRLRMCCGRACYRAAQSFAPVCLSVSRLGPALKSLLIK